MEHFISPVTLRGMGGFVKHIVIPDIIKKGLTNPCLKVMLENIDIGGLSPKELVDEKDSRGQGFKDSSEMTLLVVFQEEDMEDGDIYS